jgi:hypothetical protein
VERFVGKVESPDGGSTAFVRVPPDVAARLGPAKRPPVTATLKGYAYRTTIAVYGGEPLLGVRREIREAAGIVLDESIEITLELDTAARTVEPPPELVDAFDREPELRLGFEALAFTDRKELAESITSAKRDATRQARVERALERLRSGRPA